MIPRDEREKREQNSGTNPGKHIPGTNPKQASGHYTMNPNITVANCCRVNSTVYFGQLPSHELPEDIDDTGGTIYEGTIAYGKEIAPMWIVTSYRLAIN